MLALDVMACITMDLFCVWDQRSCCHRCQCIMSCSTTQQTQEDEKQVADMVSRARMGAVHDFLYQNE